MIRAGITDEPLITPPEHPLFGATAQAELRAIEASDVWQGLRAGLDAQREALLATPLRPQDGETLEARWGAVQQLSLLLHGGPQMILQHAVATRAAQQQEDEREREYNPAAHHFDG